MRRLKKMEAERLQEASGDKLDEEAKARRKKCALCAVCGLRSILQIGSNTSPIRLYSSTVVALKEASPRPILCANTGSCAAPAAAYWLLSTLPREKKEKEKKGKSKKDGGDSPDPSATEEVCSCPIARGRSYQLVPA